MFGCGAQCVVHECDGRRHSRLHIRGAQAADPMLTHGQSGCQVLLGADVPKPRLAARAAPPTVCAYGCVQVIQVSSASRAPALWPGPGECSAARRVSDGGAVERDQRGVAPPRRERPTDRVRAQLGQPFAGHRAHRRCRHVGRQKRAECLPHPRPGAWCQGGLLLLLPHQRPLHDGVAARGHQPLGHVASCRRTSRAV